MKIAASGFVFAATVAVAAAGSAAQTAAEGAAPTVAWCAEALSRRILPEGSEHSAHDAIFREMAAADKAADDAWRSLKSRAEFDACRGNMRRRFAEAIGGLAYPKTPLNAKNVERVERDGYSVEKILFESRPGVYVTANAFLPDPAKHKPPYRAIIQPCGHTPDGKAASKYQRGGVMGAKAGFLVLVYDPISQGEREQVPGGLCCNPHNRYGALAALLGRNTAEQRVWDGMRAIDLLYERDDVRKDGVGCMGNSGGGTLTAYLEALDARIVASCPSCYISSLRETAGAIGPQDAEQNVFGQLAFGLNHAGCVLLGSAVRMHCAIGDFFPIAGARETFAVVCDTAKNCGLDAGRYGMTDVQGPHAWTEGKRESSILWMRRWLAGDAAAPEIDVAAMRELDRTFDAKTADFGLTNALAKVTQTGRVKDLPGFKSIYDYLKDDLAAAEKGRPRRDAAALSEIARRRAGIRPVAECGVTVSEAAPPENAGGVSVLREIYAFGDGIRVPAVTFLPAGGAKGAILVTDDRSDRAIHRGRVRDALAAGKAIMVADLACTGETGALKHKFYGCRNPDEGPAVMLYMLGKSMVGVRAEETVALAGALKAKTGKGVEIVAHGRPCISAAHAYAVRRDLFAGAQFLIAPKGWAQSVRESASVPFANVVNGALADYDWTDLAR